MSLIVEHIAILCLAWKRIVSGTKNVERDREHHAETGGRWNSRREQMPRNQRRNNPEDMCVLEIIEKAAENICDNYCKYRYMMDKKLLSPQQFEHLCESDCPLRRLV